MSDVQTREKPRHPLVIDEFSRLARYATQEDIHRLEAIASAYKALVADVRERIARADQLLCTGRGTDKSNG